MTNTWSTKCSTCLIASTGVPGLMTTKGLTPRERIFEEHHEYEVLLLHDADNIRSRTRKILQMTFRVRPSSGSQRPSCYEGEGFQPHLHQS